MKGFNRLNVSVSSIHAAALLIGAAGLLSRILGIVRDRMLAAHFGASRALDIYYAAFQIPDFLFTIFLLGAASAAIIPVLADMEDKSPAAARRFIRELATLFFIGSLIIWVGAIVASPMLASRLTPGFGAGDRAMVVGLARIMMASPVLLGLSNIISSVVQTHRRFFTFALSSIFYNLGIIFGILVFLPAWGMVGLAYGVVLGAALHLAIQLPTLYELGFGFPLAWPAFLRQGFSSPVKRVMMLSLPRVIAISASSASDIALVAIASTIAPGSIAVFKFADNLRFVPIGVFGVSFAVAAFPALSAARIRRSASEFYQNFFGTFRSILFWVLPIAVFFYVLRAQIVRVGLGAGNFSWHDTRLTAALLGIMTIAIMAESLSALLIRSFYALGNTRVPLVINVAVALATIFLAMMFLALFRHQENFLLSFLVHLLHIEDVRGTAVLGLALAAAAGSAANLFFLFLGLRRVMRSSFGAGGAEASMDTDGYDMAKMCVSAILAGLACFGMLRVVNHVITLEHFFGVLLQGGVAGAAGFAVYWSLLYVIGNREILQLLDAVRRHMFRWGILPTQWNGEEVL